MSGFNVILYFSLLRSREDWQHFFAQKIDVSKSGYQMRCLVLVLLFNTLCPSSFEFIIMWKRVVDML